MAPRRGLRAREPRDRGYDGSAIAPSWPAVRAEVKAACGEAQDLLVRQLAGLSKYIERIAGRATFTGPDTVLVGERTVCADRFLIAVGSKPRVPPTIAVDGERILTSDHVEYVRELPRRLAIIGAGVVGCEYATVFAQFGRTEVELFDRQARILPFEDEDISAVVASRFAAIGVHVHRSAKIESVAVAGDEVEIVWADETGAPQRRRYDRVLVATGRAPATAALRASAPCGHRGRARGCTPLARPLAVQARCDGRAVPADHVPVSFAFT